VVLAAAAALVDPASCAPQGVGAFTDADPSIPTRDAPDAPAAKPPHTPRGGAAAPATAMLMGGLVRRHLHWQTCPWLVRPWLLSAPRQPHKPPQTFFQEPILSPGPTTRSSHLATNPRLGLRRRIDRSNGLMLPTRRISPQQTSRRRCATLWTAAEFCGCILLGRRLMRIIESPNRC
jgi:hypothetical protein